MIKQPTYERLRIPNIGFKLISEGVVNMTMQHIIFKTDRELTSEELEKLVTKCKVIIEAHDETSDRHHYDKFAGFSRKLV